MADDELEHVLFEDSDEVSDTPQQSCRVDLG